MSTELLSNFGVCTVLALLQVLAAIPWVYVLEPGAFSRRQRLSTAGIGLVLVLGGAAALVGLMQFRGDPDKVAFDGRVFASLLHLQLALDIVILTIGLLLWIWPKGGTVAMAAFREGYRQPMFWVIIALVALLLALSLVIPYFTFGEDFRMMKQISFDIIKLSTVLFVVLAAGISVSEEIEGRTAVTLMSKPVTRRDFLLGKYVGVLLAALLLTLFLGWCQNWALYLKPSFERLEDSFDPLAVAVQEKVVAYFNTFSVSAGTSGFLKGIGLWTGETMANMTGLALGFGQVMVMLAIAASLATRMTMVVTVVMCLVVYLLGNLAPILVSVSERLRETTGGAMNLVNFLAQLLDKTLPALSYFSTDQLFLRDLPPEPWKLANFVAWVLLYAALYALMALLVGLFLVEDRDLA